VFLGIDANFQLKRMNVSNGERDPGLNHGYAYIVEHKKFEKYLDEYGQQIPDDKSSCNNHDTIKSASMRGGKGTVECSCHDMKRPTAVGDLKKGERSVRSLLMVALTTNNCHFSMVATSIWTISYCPPYSITTTGGWSSHMTLHVNGHETCLLDVASILKTDYQDPGLHLHLTFFFWFPNFICLCTLPHVR
jgi:hypothetical protein